jgi:hypothetical protein
VAAVQVVVDIPEAGGVRAVAVPAEAVLGAAGVPAAEAVLGAAVHADRPLSPAEKRRLSPFFGGPGRAGRRLLDLEADAHARGDAAQI